MFRDLLKPGVFDDNHIMATCKRNFIHVFFIFVNKLDFIFVFFWSEVWSVVLLWNQESSNTKLHFSSFKMTHTRCRSVLNPLFWKLNKNLCDSKSSFKDFNKCWVKSFNVWFDHSSFTNCTMVISEFRNNNFVNTNRNVFELCNSMFIYISNLLKIFYLFLLLNFKLLWK